MPNGAVAGVAGFLQGCCRASEYSASVLYYVHSLSILRPSARGRNGTSWRRTRTRRHGCSPGSLTAQSKTTQDVRAKSSGIWATINTVIAVIATYVEGNLVPTLKYFFVCIPRFSAISLDHVIKSFILFKETIFPPP